ncbi:hypothetical protein [Streptomyces zhihengii]
MRKPSSRGGRPTIGPKVETRLPEATLREVDNFAQQHDLSRSEALRQLVTDGLLVADRRMTHIETGAISGQKIQPDAIESGPIDPDDPVYVETLIRWALKKVGMSETEARLRTDKHAEQAVDRYRHHEK